MKLLNNLITLFIITFPIVSLSQSIEEPKNDIKSFKQRQLELRKEQNSLNLIYQEYLKITDSLFQLKINDSTLTDAEFEMYQDLLYEQNKSLIAQNKLLREEMKKLILLIDQFARKEDD